ncbi:glycosyltransferase family 39 protein [Actinomadura madurae]|uniref:glycosyltransferase family 39 protein n=1 Tax=Actinomadura madurae TaxID=1993 RepID=UPI0020D242DF|nr:glycosyltransferase family 39 protein [Actinomadura madurae]MCP9967095.1 glycosyltransferase family 39 protein [Actinomadura madurae]
MPQITSDDSAARTVTGGEPEDGPSGSLLARAARRVRRTRRVVWLSLLVTAATVLAQWTVMTPPLYFDPYYVWLAARDWPDIPLAQWPFDEVPHQVTRIGLVLPARLAQEVLGDGQAAYFAVAGLGGAAFFVGTYLVVRSLFGDVAGVASAAILLVHPFFTMTNPFGHEITWSTGVMLPDMPGAGLFTIGMAGLVVASRRTGRAQTWMLLAAGVFLGASFLVREFLAFLFLAIPAYLALLRIPWRRNVTVGAPMLAILLLNFVHNQIVWGSPLAGLVSAAEHGGQSRDYVTRALAARSFLRAMHDWNPLGLVFTAALALTIVGWAVTRDRRLGLCLVWFCTLAVPLTLFSGVLDPNSISLRAWLQRYWFSVLPALLARRVRLAHPDVPDAAVRPRVPAPSADGRRPRPRGRARRDVRGRRRPRRPRPAARQGVERAARLSRRPPRHHADLRRPAARADPHLLHPRHVGASCLARRDPRLPALPGAGPAQRDGGPDALHALARHGVADRRRVAAFPGRGLDADVALIGRGPATLESPSGGSGGSSPQK